MNDKVTSGSEYELVIKPYSVVSLRDLADVWRFRELLWTMATRDIRVRYKQAFFGIAWALLLPLLHVFIFTMLFNRVAGIKADVPVPYAVFCFCGVVVWSLFSTGLAQASSSLVENARVISKVYFPRIVIPLSSVMVALVDFAIAFVILVGTLLVFGVTPGPTALLAPVFALMAAICAVAIGLWTSALNLQYRDVRYALPFFLQLLIFVTPVFFPSSLVPERYQIFVVLNPMAAIVDGFRASLLGTPIPWERLAIALPIVFTLAIAGFGFFRRLEHKFADRA